MIESKGFKNDRSLIVCAILYGTVCSYSGVRPAVPFWYHELPGAQKGYLLPSTEFFCIVWGINAKEYAASCIEKLNIPN